jgi:hypothetical protein
MTLDTLRLRLLLDGIVSTVLVAAYVLTVVFERHVERRAGKWKRGLPTCRRVWWEWRPALVPIISAVGSGRSGMTPD